MSNVVNEYFEASKILETDCGQNWTVEVECLRVRLVFQSKFHLLFDGITQC